MQCREVMSRVPSFLRTEQSVAEAAEMMREQDVGFLPICDPQSKVLGALTDRDIVLRIVAARRSLDTAVRDVMSPECVTCRQDDELDKAEELMEKHQVSRVMCVDNDGTLVGILGMADVARRDAGHLREVVREVKNDQDAATH